MNHRYLNTPWSTANDLYSPPGSLVVKVALGEAPDAIPAQLDVRRGTRAAATALGVGSVDRVFRHLSDRVRITRVHSSAAAQGRPGQGHLRFDETEHLLGLSRTFRVEVDVDTSVTWVVDALRQLGVVEKACPNYLSVLPFDNPTAVLTDENAVWQSRQQIHAVEAMGYEPGDPAVIIAVVDTGVAQNHPELMGRLRSGMDTVQLASTQLATGIQLVGDQGGQDTDPEDWVGHGTSCATIIGGLGNRIPPGLAGDCGLLPVRVLGAAQFPGKNEPMGIGAMADIDQGLKSAIDLGAKVLNLSFGTPESLLDDNDPLPHEDVIHYGLARNCIMVAASGNSGQEEQFSPASLPGVIAVGAVNAENNPTSFSTRGDHVALSAPGERVLSAGLQGYQLVTGTSFAAPFVAAAVGLLISRANRRSYPLDGTAVREILCQSADPWPERLPRGCGAGVLNVVAALQLLDERINTDGPSTISRSRR